MKKEMNNDEMLKLAALVRDNLPKGFGMTLLVFEEGTTACEVRYISTANRQDMRETMKTLTNKWEALEKFQNPGQN